MKRLIYIALILLTGASPVIAASGLGTSAAEILNFKTSARSEALAGAQSASGDDLSALSVNPATLSSLKYSEILFSQAFLYEDIRYSYLAFAKPTKYGVP